MQSFNRTVACIIAATLLTACERQQPEHETWREYGGGPSHIQYSSLDQVNRANVGQLEVAWTYDAGGTNPGNPAYHETRRVHHTPIILDGVLYAIGGDMRVFALDAATGELIWEHVLDTDEELAGPGAVVNRGLMHWRGERTAIYVAFALPVADSE